MRNVSTKTLRLSALLLALSCCLISWLRESRGLDPFSDLKWNGKQLQETDNQHTNLPQFDVNQLMAPEQITIDKRHRNQSIDQKDYDVPWSGIENAEWCKPPAEPQLPYEDCQWDSFVLEFGVHGGLTNALHFILKGMFLLMSLYMRMVFLRNIGNVGED